MTTMDTLRHQSNEHNSSFLVINETNRVRNISQFVGYKTYILFPLINGFGLTNTIAVFGVFSNSLNIIVYLKLGLRETTNISFLALGISDWLFCVCSFLSVTCHLSEISPYGAAMTNLDTEISVVTLPCLGLGAWVIVLLSAERCLCIVMPLKVCKHNYFPDMRAYLLPLQVCISISQTAICILNITKVCEPIIT